ncbi:MAG: septal ring lytic transglycosylase RlpA family protein [Rhodospirillaceae bacterium]
MLAIDVGLRRNGLPDLVRHAFLLALVLALGACGGYSGPGAVGDRGRAASRGYYKVGNPYQINGVWYYPAENYEYDESGIASWYGPGFHKEQTANGETFNQEEVTAAHKTLPMPCLVRVTNLENGRVLVVRVNDRGPFVGSRIIDLSHRSAQLLGFDRVGTAKVRVQILADESRAVAAAARAGAPVEMSGLGPAPVAAPRGAVEVAGLAPPKPPAARPAVAPPATVAGTTEEGRFLPAPVVRQGPVTGGHQIYVQAGAFSQLDNANRVRDRVAGFGAASISQARVGNTQFYRVRLGPIDSVDQADAVLARVVGAGNSNARVIVD